jgi:hypothetical protein
VGWATCWETRSGLMRGSYRNVSRAQDSTCMSERWDGSECLGLVSHHFYPPDSLGGGSDWFTCGLPGSLCNSYPYDTNPQQLPSRLGGPPPNSVACASSSLPRSSFLSAWPSARSIRDKHDLGIPSPPLLNIISPSRYRRRGSPCPARHMARTGCHRGPLAPPRAFPPDTCSLWLELDSTRTTTP